MTTPDLPLHSGELSAYLDGELPPARALEIEAALARDPALRAVYETLRALDARWREAAAGATFTPPLEFAPRATARGRSAWVAAAVGVLLLARIATMFIEALGTSLGLNLTALALAGLVMLAMARTDRARA